MSRLHRRQFINMALELMSLKYNQNRQQLHKLMNTAYTVPEPVSVILNYHLCKDSDIDEIKRLVREQIKINKMIGVGRTMINQVMK
jgi:hypothetical protein